MFAADAAYRYLPTPAGAAISYVHRDPIALGPWAEIVGVVNAGARQRLLGQEQVAPQRLEHVLPRADRARMADREGATGRDRPEDVRHDAVDGEVPPAYHVAGTRRDDRPLGLARKALPKTR